MKWSPPIANDEVTISGYEVFYETVNDNKLNSGGETTSTQITVSGLQRGSVVQFYVTTFSDEANTLSSELTSSLSY